MLKVKFLGNVNFVLQTHIKFALFNRFEIPFENNVPIVHFVTNIKPAKEMKQSTEFAKLGFRFNE